jgi:hypothetical protein
MSGFPDSKLEEENDTYNVGHGGLRTIHLLGDSGQAPFGKLRTHVVRPARISVYGRKMSTHTSGPEVARLTVKRDPIRSFCAPEPSSLNHRPTAECATWSNPLGKLVVEGKDRTDRIIQSLGGSSHDSATCSATGRRGQEGSLDKRTKIFEALCSSLGPFSVFYLVPASLRLLTTSPVSQISDRRKLRPVNKIQKNRNNLL